MSDVWNEILQSVTRLNLAILLYSLLIPAAIVGGRANVKAKRQQIIRDLQKTFAFDEITPGKEPIIPSFEFVKFKYNVNENGERDDTPVLSYLFPALIFSLICFLGFQFAFSPTNVADYKAGSTSIVSGLHTAYLDITVEQQVMSAISNEHGRTVMRYAFLGAYLFCLGFLLRSISNFDLTPLSFLHATGHILTAWFVSLAIFAAVPDFFTEAGNAVQAGVAELTQETAPAATAGETQHRTTTGECAHKFQVAPADATFEAARRNLDACQFAYVESNTRVTPLFLGLSFLIGLFPTLGIANLASRFPGLRLKQVDQSAFRASRTVPLDVIDGIDTAIKFRLEVFQIADVQNLATVNPILMFVETPFGIYEILDWVAQAQLVTAVGPEKVIELRKLNIRTIFDLTCFATDFSPDDAGTADPGSGSGKRRRSPSFCKKLADILFGIDLPALECQAALDDMVHVIQDDLHVRRLNQIWVLLSRRLRVEPLRWPAVREPVGSPEGRREQDAVERRELVPALAPGAAARN